MNSSVLLEARWFCAVHADLQAISVPASAASTGNGSPTAAATYGFEGRKYGLAVGAWMAGGSQCGRGLCLGTMGATIHWRAWRRLPWMTRAAGGNKLSGLFPCHPWEKGNLS